MAWGSEAPCRIGHSLLLLAFTYRLQAQIYGGLKPHIKAKLRQIAGGHTTIKPVPQIKSGTRLLREWRGNTHEVLVLSYCPSSCLSRGAVLRQGCFTCGSGSAASGK